MEKGTWVTIFIILVIIGVSYYAISGNVINGNTTENSNDDFAKCIGQKATLYMQTGCYACQKQEELFGENYKYITKVNCADNLEECAKLGITQTPTWVINNQKYIGYKTLEQLSELTGCELKKSEVSNQP